MMSYCMILTTCPDKSEAETLAAALVKEKLAACVQVSRVTSVYTWEGELCTDPEFRLVIKTRKMLYEPVEKFITSRHSYEVPQIIQVPVTEGFDPYLDWIDDSTREIS